MAGRLLGIARKARPRAAMEELPRAMIGLATGVRGDCRGSIRPGGSSRRQVTIMCRDDWLAALDEIGGTLPWTARRVNLLVDGVLLPRQAGTRVRIGELVTFEITGECDPCRRMETAAIGLEAALTPHWRGGRLLRVVVAGELYIGDAVSVLA